MKKERSQHDIFLNMEKPNYNNKVIHSLRKNQNDTKSILNGQKKLYEDLYTSKLQAGADPTLCDWLLSSARL